jgi:hypothetical protein
MSVKTNKSVVKSIINGVFPTMPPAPQNSHQVLIVCGMYKNDSFTCDHMDNVWLGLEDKTFPYAFSG